VWPVRSLQSLDAANAAPLLQALWGFGTPLVGLDICVNVINGVLADFRGQMP